VARKKTKDERAGKKPRTEQQRTKAKKPSGAREPLSPAKAAVFTAIALLLPFALLACLEIGLRVKHYGGEMSAFDTPAVLKGLYKVPGENVGKRYFPQEQYPPSPPGDPFLVTKPAHSMRLFVFGESSAAGFPYPPNGTFARVLRDALTDVLPSDTVEVVNMGMAATNSFTIADLAQDVIDQKPDGIIIYGGHNEYYGALGAGSTESLGSYPSFVRFYLKLQNLKTFLLLRNTVNSALALVRGGRSTKEIENDPSRMESVVSDQSIKLGDDVYKRGVAQYGSNLRYAIGKFRRAGIPVFIGSTPSNLRDIVPFGQNASPPDLTARKEFDLATQTLASGDSINAATQFAKARDLDVVRFRAPGEFQPLIQKIARETGSTYVPAVEGFAAAAKYGIPGSDLFLEHVHPTQAGYVLLARLYFDALRKANFLGRQADMSRLATWDEYTRRMKLTRLDSLIAYHTIKTVMTRWPFVPVSANQDYRGTYKPVDVIDSVAFNTSRGGMPWARAKMVTADIYAARGQTDSAVAEYDGLIRDEPGIEIAYRLAGRVLLFANQPDRAKWYLERAFTLSPSGATAFALGKIAMQEKDLPHAIAMLQQAVNLSPTMAPALYQLSLAYALSHDIDRARSVALELARMAPNYPGLAQWMNTIGLVQR
jgi:tetratricopeptide (TPR) repeat protein